jgi:hypothetical protein
MFQSSDTKIAVLEERLSVYEQMIVRIDSAIEKISETNQNISRMLAVHTEKIEQGIKTDNIIVTMIDDIKKSSKEQHEEIARVLAERIERVEEKVDDITKIKWMTLGCGAVLVVLVAAIATLASGWWTPPGIQDNVTIQQEQPK